MIIDVHTHILPPHIPPFKKMFGYGGFIELIHPPGGGCAHMVKDDGTPFRTIKDNCWDPLKRLEECAEYGVTMQVLSTVPVMFNYGAKAQDTLVIAQYLNDHIADICQKYPKHFCGLGTVPLQNVELSIGELHRVMKDLKLQGLQIGSNIQGKNLGHPSLHPFYAEMEKLGAALFVHPWDMPGTEHMQEYWMPWLVSMPAETTRALCSMIFGGVLEKFPRLKVAFSHGGGQLAATFGRICHGYEARPDLCAIDNPHHPSRYLGRFFVDGLVHHTATLQHLIGLVGTEQVMMGSDYPFPLGEDVPGLMIRQNITDSKLQQKLLYQNAQRWLGLNGK